MRKYLKRKESSSPTPISVVEMDNLPWDPYDRPRILQYNPNQRDEIRRQYWIRGPSQPRGYDFPKTNGTRFIKAWFDKYCNWIEYSVKADRAFCLCCYLFRDHIGDQGGNEAFVTYCLKCAPFRGHDETELSLCKRNFLELEIGDDVFALLVDESSEVSKKEQLAIVIRYVDTHGLVKERFVGLVHVNDTSSLSLKSSIDSFFAKHKLSFSQLRGQGYDGASNMRGEFNGLKAKILEENNLAYYIHCFAHQLQLVVVSVARKHLAIVNFFDKLAILMSVVCASCKRKDILIDEEKERVEKGIGSGIIETGRGLNQELSLIRPRDTRWNSHYKTLLRLVEMFPSIIKILEYVKEEGTNGLTNLLSQALQRKDQDIIESVSLVELTKEKLQEFRTMGFESLLKKMSSFCEKYDIQMLKMNVNCVNSRRKKDKTTNQHYYEVECFNTVVDMQIQEFGDRFSEASNKLLISMVALNPRDSFSMFDASKLIRLSEFYPRDFDSLEMVELEDEFLNACVICSVEKEALSKVKDEDVIQRFQKMRFRKGKV
ncbi:uncharacterized protein [Rutidosis leptorrhynchoides]|uniref:uncharacterized protein n=1 Tax=Rutidosis leptorrhynchoides TaxID=125765 RepID=UPI003A995D8F